MPSSPGTWGVWAGCSKGETANEAIRAYLGRPAPTNAASLHDVRPEAYPVGNERLSEEIDDVVYGT